MGIGVSLFLIAAGAILRYAVTAHVNGISLGTAGAILMILGVVGILASLCAWVGGASWPLGRRRTYHERVTDDEGHGYERTKRTTED